MSIFTMKQANLPVRIHISRSQKPRDNHKTTREKTKACYLLYKSKLSYSLSLSKKIGFYIKRSNTLEKE